MFACTPAQVPVGTFACGSDDDCSAGEVCVVEAGGGRCQAAVADVSTNADAPETSSTPDIDATVGVEDAPAVGDGTGARDGSAGIEEAEVYVEPDIDVVIDIEDHGGATDTAAPLPDSIEDADGDADADDADADDADADDADADDADADDADADDADADDAGDADAEDANGGPDAGPDPSIEGDWLCDFADGQLNNVYIRIVQGPGAMDASFTWGEKYFEPNGQICEGTFNGTLLECTWDYFASGQYWIGEVDLTYLPDVDGMEVLTGTWFMPNFVGFLTTFAVTCTRYTPP